MFRDTYVNDLKCNFAVILSHRQLKFCPWGFRPLEFETADKVSYLFSVKSYHCLNNKINAVSWADHNFSTIPSIKILSVDSICTGLKTPWTKFELPVPQDNGKVTF